MSDMEKEGVYKIIMDLNMKFNESILNLSTQLGKLNANIESQLSKLTDHERRLTAIETKGDDDKEKKEDDFKTMIAKYSIKAVIVLGTAICAIAGGGGLLVKILSCM